MDALLESMLRELEGGKAVYLPSKYWEALNRKNLEQLGAGRTSSGTSCGARPCGTGLPSSKGHWGRWFLPVSRGSFTRNSAFST